MDTFFHRLTALSPTRFWINNVTSEEARLALEAGATGCTQNPSYVWKMIESEPDIVYAHMDKIIPIEPNNNEVVVKLQGILIQRIAKLFLPLYESTGSKHGYVSIQGDPFHEDANTLLHHAHCHLELSANIIIKIPVTSEGLTAIQELAAKQVPILATEIMSVRQALDAVDAYERATRGLSHPAPLYLAHISGIYDQYLAAYVKNNNIDISHDVLWQAGIALAKKSYEMLQERNSTAIFMCGGARGIHHFTEMIGAKAAVTINWKGCADTLIKQDPVVVPHFLRPTPASAINELLTKVPEFRRSYDINSITHEEYRNFGPVVLFRSMFEESWQNACNAVAERRMKINKERR